ncbi:MAG: prepilin-type N-terminal cleavage/methylation domain-containing protein [Bdellovibrionales bacterium]|jgi:general secretion pathway protein I|nr:prepilin-type N-terminal cleavage/methylation domain-containing protein [Bdellovibrionales bacterium]
MNNRGFTLMETLVAVMIMTGGLIVIGSSWSSNFMRIEKARMNTNMASLLERKMTETDLQYRGRPLAEIPEEDAGEFEGDDLKHYRWELRSKEFEIPDMTGLIAGASGSSQSTTAPEQGEMMALIARTVTEYVSSSVKEVTVTVYYKSPRAKAKEMAQSISTYFVDYSKPMSIGGLPAGLDTGATGSPGGGQ